MDEEKNQISGEFATSPSRLPNLHFHFDSYKDNQYPIRIKSLLRYKMFHWNQEMIRYQKQEFETNPLYVLFSQEIVRYVGKGLRICDAGCGLGFLSQELSRQGEQVIAVDTEPLVIKEVQALNDDNITVREGDIHSLAPSLPYQAMVFCNFGSTIETLALGKSQCQGKIVLIKKNWEAHRFSQNFADLKGNPAQCCRQLLSSLAIAFEESTLVSECGPRFSSIGDAQAFFTLYHTEISKEELQKKLIRKEGAFPFSYPEEESFTFFVIETKDLPDFSQLKNLLIVGPRHIGKSTLLQNIGVGSHQLCGFLTQKVGEKVYIQRTSGQVPSCLDSHCIGTCRNQHAVARANIFDTLGCSILEEKGELRIMDEIGFMENSSPLFQKAVLSALEDDIPTMACVKDKETPFLSSVRKTRKSLAFSLSVENRDSLTYEIKRAIHGTPEWLFASKLKTISE